MADDTNSKPKRKLPAKETRCPYCDHITTAAGIYLHVKTKHDEKFIEYKAAHPTNPANERRRQEQKARKIGQQPVPQAAPPRPPTPAPAGDAKPQVQAQSFPAAAPTPRPEPRQPDPAAKPAEQPKKHWWDENIF